MVNSKPYLDAIERIQDLHANMSVLARLSQLLRDTNAPLDTAARLIESDGALASSIIKISNSAFYGTTEKSRDVHSALRKVGLDQALRLVGIAMSKQVFMRDLNAYGLSADDYWLYSYFSGVFMETAARRQGLNPDDAYLLGLLHAIGRVVINELLREEKVEIYWSPSVPACEWEEIMVGFHYDTAGAHLLKNWKFPELICRQIQNQGDAMQYANDPLLTLLAFTRAYAEVNRWDVSNPDWKLPESVEDKASLCGDPEAIDSDLCYACKQVQAIYETLQAC